VKTYTNQLFKLQSLDFDMDNQDSILNFFNNDDFTYFYKKNNLTSLNVFLQALDKPHDKVKKKMLELKNIYELNNEKTDKDKKNWVSKKELIDIYNSKLKVLHSLDINKSKKKKLNSKEYKILQDYLIMSLYLLIPPRRNIYSNTIFITNKLYNKLSSDDIENKNYLVYSNRNNMFFSFGDWKNSSIRGTVILKINNKKLKQVIILWYKFNKDRVNKWLLVNTKGDRMTSNTLTKHLNYIFSETGKKISSTIIRKIMVSENENVKKYNEVKDKVKELADNMGHTVNTQQTTYFKKDT